MNSPKNHEWEYLLDIDDSDLNLSAPLRLTNSSNFNDAPTQEMDHVDEKSSRIIPGPAGFFQTDRIHQLNNFNDAPTQEYIRKLYDDVSEGEDFKMLSWVKALEYINDNGEIGGGCFGDIKSYLKKGKLEKVVAIITSCKPNMLGDMNVTLKDPSGTISGTIHYKVLLNDDVAKGIKVGSAIILQNVSVFCPKSGEFYLNITIRNLVQIFQNVTVMEDANGASSSNISFQE
ncbi:transposase, MuDR, MULE transposase domain protein [Tanacetum coccineum]